MNDKIVRVESIDGVGTVDSVYNFEIFRRIQEGETVTVFGKEFRMLGVLPARVITVLGLSLVPEERQKNDKTRIRPVSYYKHKTFPEVIQSIFLTVITFFLCTVVLSALLVHFYYIQSWSISFGFGFLVFVFLLACLFAGLKIHTFFMGKRVAVRFLDNISWSNCGEERREKVLSVLRMIPTPEKFVVTPITDLEKMSFAAKSVLSFLKSKNKT